MPKIGLKTTWEKGKIMNDQQVTQNQGTEMTGFKPTLKETRPQRWRAVAVNKEDQSGLIYVGYSEYQVKCNYRETYNDMFDESSKKETSSIRLERWIGSPANGYWVKHEELPF